MDKWWHRITGMQGMRARIRIRPTRFVKTMRTLPLRTFDRLTDGRHAIIPDGHGAGLRFLGGSSRYDRIKGSSEKPVQDAIFEHLKPGAVFYDVGANLGFFSVLAARAVGPMGHVVAFEPIPANIEAIKRNLARNDFKNVTVVEAAASGKTGKERFRITRSHAGGVLSSSGVIPNDAKSEMEVRTQALDDGIESGIWPKPNLIKIDVEGSELEVLQGLDRTLQRHRPILVIEFDSGDLSELEKRRSVVRRLLEEYSYRISPLAPSYPNIAWHVCHDIAIPQQ